MTEFRKVILTIALFLVLTNFISAVNSQSVSIEVFHDHRGDHEFCEIRWNGEEYSSKIKDEFRIVDCEDFLNNVQASRGWTIEIENFFNDFDKVYSCKESGWNNAGDLLNENNKIKIGEATDKYTLTRYCEAGETPDTTAPVITDIDTNPNMPFTNDGDQQNLIVDFNSNEYPITIRFNLYNDDDNLVNSQGPISIPNSNSLPVNYVIPANLDEGNYYLYMTATDSSGNSRTVYIGTFNVNYGTDTTAPVITVVSPDKVESSSTILFKIKTNEPATAWFNVKDLTTNRTMNAEAGNVFTYSLKNMKEGEYTVRFYARDLAGNLAEKQIRFEIDFTDNHQNNDDENKTFEFGNELISLNQKTKTGTTHQTPIELNLEATTKKASSNCLLWLLILGIILLLLLILIIYLMKRN